MIIFIQEIVKMFLKMRIDLVNVRKVMHKIMKYPKILKLIEIEMNLLKGKKLSL